MASDLEEPRVFSIVTQSSGGDVLAARACAKDILAPLQASGEAARDAQLILTALCLHLHGASARVLDAAGLRSILRRLARSGAHDRLLLKSPLQFVRYASAELQDAHPDTRAAALDLAMRGVDAVAL